MIDIRKSRLFNIPTQAFPRILINTVELEDALVMLMHWYLMGLYHLLFPVCRRPDVCYCVQDGL